MLTFEALNERKWGGLPALRKVLESKRVPESHFGLTSVSDSVFDWFHRTLEVALTVTGNEPDIAKAAQASSEELLADLRRLQEALRGVMSFVEDTSRNIRQIEEAVDRAGRNPLP
jgi:hypothetical protein